MGSARAARQLVCTVVSIALVCATSAAAGAQTLLGPPVTVAGPIPVRVTPGDPSNDFVFSMSGMDLAGHGYIEQEFFVEGIANRYTRPEMETAEVVDGGHPYKTRFIVRRPAAAADFNGTVVVEWNNVTAGRDLDIDWLQVGEHLMRNGYAWIGLSAQLVPQPGSTPASRCWRRRPARQRCQAFDPASLDRGRVRRNVEAPKRGRCGLVGLGVGQTGRVEDVQ